MKSRVLLADDHQMVRAGLAALLRREPDLEVVAELGDGDEALAFIQANRPDLAILDVQMPKMTGIEVARQTRALKLRSKVLLLSMHTDPNYVRAALEAGANGYVIKQAAPEELLDAVRAVLRGQIYVSSSLNLNPGELRRGLAGAPQDALTPREREVLRLLAQGLSTKEIATALEVSVRTVDGHRAAIIDKLDIRTVQGLVKYALKIHLIGMDD